MTAADDTEAGDEDACNDADLSDGNNVGSKGSGMTRRRMLKHLECKGREEG